MYLINFLLIRNFTSFICIYTSIFLFCFSNIYILIILLNSQKSNDIMTGNILLNWRNNCTIIGFYFIPTKDMNILQNSRKEKNDAIRLAENEIKLSCTGKKNL